MNRFLSVHIIYSHFTALSPLICQLLYGLSEVVKPAHLELSYFVSLKQIHTTPLYFTFIVDIFLQCGWVNHSMKNKA